MRFSLIVLIFAGFVMAQETKPNFPMQDSAKTADSPHKGKIPETSWAVNDFKERSNQVYWIGAAASFVDFVSGVFNPTEERTWKFWYSYPDRYIIDYTWNSYVFKEACLVQFVANFSVTGTQGPSIEGLDVVQRENTTVTRKAVSAIYVKNTEGKYRLFQIDMASTELINKYAKEAWLEFRTTAKPIAHATPEGTEQ
jgi:hypothetical protein